MYVPILSSSMIGYVEAPGYFVMGCHSDYLETIEQVEGLVIVDIDKGKIISSNSGEYAASLPLKAASRFCTAVCIGPCYVICNQKIMQLERGYKLLMFKIY